ncbi:maleylpyruvate isomerase N-terminal domain-containing protein [Mumia zhuanghuii]|uniref:Maleylpyruvate isomerase family mycothiol-dependent enzyme n=1 Tax=Mumia zhuanghuii TaxID=2585211 RepID=A0A5C4N098_9ACTN|nr:maleylpyruvate isomerase N-terminal domain-containing protein [Mumia zhuanghuii]TNC49938.1 maleylpyruvate isomerase family mycothiol-dependent enzyme [Mumia zhuanghuii]TNC50223.1 maleylpyruvate isomerase family mycothiol-dependent enzyme [Mumia zhuanghuii]
MPIDLESDPDRASGLCRAAYRRLFETVARLTDDQIGRPCRLPGWSVGHVLSHLARNADGHSRRLEGALKGRDVPKYAGGSEQRAKEISDGAARPAAELIADLAASQRRLEDLFTEMSAAGWPNPHLVGDTSYGPRGCPSHRLREIEMHHVDLGLGYTPTSWPDEYVEWELEVLLSTVPDRLADPRHRRELVAWLAGRAPVPSELALDPWG